MKKEILLITLIIASVCFGQRRYYHETEDAILRVDEQYPGAFAEHRYIASGSDNLFRAFLALGEDDGANAWGSAHVYEPFLTGSFIITDSLDIFEFYETIIDTDSTGAPVDTDSVLVGSETIIAYADTAFGVTVVQQVIARNDSIKSLIAKFAVRNDRATPLTGLRIIFFYDGDVPDYLYIDDYPQEYAYLDAVGIRDGESNITSGFCGLIPNSGMACGAWKNWIDTLVVPDSSLMGSLVNTNPVWPVDSASIAGDWSSFGLWEFPDMLSGAVETLSIAFIVSSSAGGFESLAAEARGDSVIPYIADQALPTENMLTVSPNPFNSACRIKIIGESSSEVRIFDLSGRLVRSITPSNKCGISDVTWNGRNDAGRDLPSGVYLISQLSRDGRNYSSRAVLIR
ncbi:T9SS type A sorting domain-containing protein [bacterium]|nr:T9SS type A sorting domain-containing protein [bacterium]